MVLTAPMQVNAEEPQPQPQPKAAQQPQPKPQAKPQPQQARAEAPQPMPQDFVFEAEHPVIQLPFRAQIGNHTLTGHELSVTAAYVAIDGRLDPAWKGHREIVRLQFDFPGFSVVLLPEMVVVGSRHDGEMTLQFMDPAGAHLPQLRYILNTAIAGDFVSLGGMLSYTGPTQPKAARAAESSGGGKLRLRSVAVALLSMMLIVSAVGLMLSRATQSEELRPVFIERAGKEMRATTAGQVGYLNPAAKSGEVVFSVNANSGDVLNFKLPCDCEVIVTEGVFEGSTVLPFDSILSFFEPGVDVSVKTQISIEGLAKAMDGAQAYLDLSDGRTIPVSVVVTSATNAAADRGEPFVPVRLLPEDGVLNQDDIGKSARLRLSRSWFGGSIPKLLE